MKNVKTPLKRCLQLIVVPGALMLFLSSCLKDHNTYYNPPVGALLVVQASPDEAPLNFFLNNNPVNGRPLQFGDVVGYIRAYTGSRTANFNNAATGGQLITDSVHINQNQYYSLFLANTSAHPQYLYLADTLNQPAAGKAGIRFINLSPDAGAVDFSVVSGGASVANKSFLGHSGFIPVAAGNYTLQVNKAGTNTSLASLTGVSLNAGTVYTIWLQGLKTSTGPDDTLGINLLTNAQF